MKGTLWSEQMRCNVAEMDEMHEALFTQIQGVEALQDEDFKASLNNLIANVERDFAEEEDLMEGAQSPTLQRHREEHAKMLAALHHVMSTAMQGDCSPARRAVELLPQWFQLHILTMDMPFAAAWLSAGK